MNNLKRKLSKNIELKNAIIKYYIDENLTRKEAADKVGLSLWTFNNMCKIFGIEKDIEAVVKRREQTCLDKYGETNPAKTKEVKEKIGSKNHENKETRVAKIKQTKKEIYGNENYNNIEQNKLTKKIRYNNENYNNRDKSKETTLEHHGVDNIFKKINAEKSNIQKILDDSDYTDLFKELHQDRDKAIAYLKENKSSYYDLTKVFNAPYYTIQAWATRLNIKDYIDFKFEGKSHYEDEIVNFINSLDITNIIRNSKQYLDGQEIDIYLPDYKIGIEFDGTFWHSDLYKNSDYHFNKSLLAQEKGIRLIHIYQYEWDNDLTREKIKQLLKISLGKVERRIYARDCEIRQITNKEAKVLNDKVHLQNHRNAKVTYGLFYNNELVQLMSFSHNKKYEWEIIRGCPGSNNIVVGGVSKLFKHFVKDYNPSEVFSYCDFNKFDGRSYEKLGMAFIGYTGPDMKYIIKGNIVNRQPSKYKEIKSQVEARIYGAGSKKYLWKIK